MYSPYRPNLDSPDVANPFQAETFEAPLFGLKLGFKGSLGALRTNLKSTIKTVLKKTFGSKRNIRKLMRGADDSAIEYAIKNPDKAVESLAEQTTKYIHVTRGQDIFASKKKFIDDLPANWKPEAGQTTNIKGIEYSNDIISPFYQSGGKKRTIKFDVSDSNKGKQTTEELERIGTDGNVLTDASSTPGATNDMESALKQLETSVEGNPIKTSMDDLNAGKLSDEGIETATKEIAAGGKGAYGDDYIKSLDNSSLNSKSLSTQSADDVATRALGTKSKFGLGIAAIVVGGWVANNLLSDFASRLWGDDCTREYFEEKFPDASNDELDAKVEACLDEAAKRIMYLGAAGIGVGLLILLFITSRIFQKKKIKYAAEG